MTDKALAADQLLMAYGGLEGFVAARRMRFDPVPWAQIARDITDATAGRITVSKLTLRSWFRDAKRDDQTHRDDSDGQRTLIDRVVS